MRMGPISKGFCSLDIHAKVTHDSISDIMEFEQIDTDSDNNCSTCLNNDKPGYQVARNRPPFM